VAQGEGIVVLRVLLRRRHLVGCLKSAPNPAPCVLRLCRLFEVRLSRSHFDCIRLGNNLVVFLRPEGVPIGVLGLASLIN